MFIDQFIHLKVVSKHTKSPKYLIISEFSIGSIPILSTAKESNLPELFIINSGGQKYLEDTSEKELFLELKFLWSSNPGWL